MVETATGHFAAERRSIDSALATFGERYLSGVHPPVAEAIRYGLAGEGKRLRAILLLSAYESAGGSGDMGALAASVEVVHAYSLIHDDLPCMDDDDVRRGRPTVHRVHGVGVAAAAGLAMVPLAALWAYDAARGGELPRGVCSAIVRELMQAAGAGGMIGGQLLDLQGEGHALSVAELEQIHRAKTGALIAAAVRIGALAAQARPEGLRAFDHFGSSLGLAFQIADDVLDVTSTTHELGKTAGRDLTLRKSTYPAVLGIAGAVARAEALVDDACTALSGAGLLTPPLESIARFIVARRS